MLSTFKEKSNIMIDYKYPLKVLVTLAIEKTLLDIGELAYEKVVGALYEKNHCLISGCFEKPEYLRSVLKDLYEESYYEIINSIKQELKESIENKRIEEFLQILLQ